MHHIDQADVKFSLSQYQFSQFDQNLYRSNKRTFRSSGKFPCLFCTYNGARDNKDFKRHIVMMHQERNEPLLCTKFWCEKPFNTMFELKKHRLNCKMLICPEKDWSFQLKFKHQVEPHKRYHQKLKQNKNMSLEYEDISHDDYGSDSLIDEIKQDDTIEPAEPLLLPCPKWSHINFGIKC